MQAARGIAIGGTASLENGWPQGIQSFIDAYLDIVFISDPQGRVLYVNRAFQSITGYPDEAVLGRRPGELLRCAETDPLTAAAIDNAIAEHRALECDIVNARRDGTLYYAEVRLTPIMRADGTVEGMLFAERDVTQLYEERARRTEAEEESRRLRDQLRVAIDTIPDGLVLFDANDRLVISNDRYHEIYDDDDAFDPMAGFAELVRRDIARGKFPDAAGREEAWLAERVASFRNPGDPVIQRLDDGTWLRITERRTLDGGLVSLRTDITELREKQLELERINAELKAALAAQAAAEERFFDIAAISADWFWEQDHELRFTFISESLRDSTGHDPRYTIGGRREDIAAAEIVSPYSGNPDWLEERISRREPFQDFVYQLSPPLDGGGRSWVRISGAPIFDNAGTFKGYRGVGSNITPLIEARQRAEEADRAKSEFLATMSHEIRTPMTAVIGHAEMLVRESDPARVADHARTIGEAGAMMLSLVNDCLDLARIEQGRLLLRTNTLTPADLVERVGRLLRPQAEEKGLEITFVVSAAARAPRLGDETRLIQMLTNLVGNAIAYTDEGHVEISADVDEEGRVLFGVCDTGPGLTQAEAECLFERFAQGPLANQQGGSGLGLAVVNQLTGLMGGTIHIRACTDHNGGTKITLTLPLVMVADAEQDDPLASTPDSAAPAPSLPRRVLVVDDVALNREIMGLLLDALGVEHVIVDSGPAALSVAQTEPFDAYLVDISM
ncbi:MAG: ATP-binding protein, partial [Pseudomonadota bacterium]